MAASPAVARRDAGRAPTLGSICEARAFDVACRGEASLRRRPRRAAGAAVRPPGYVRRRSPRAGWRPSRSSSGAGASSAFACGRATRRIGCHHLLWAGSAAGLAAALAPDAVAPAQAPGGRARRRATATSIAALVGPRRAARRHAAAGAGDRRSVAAADRGQRRRDHGGTAVAARPAADSPVDRMRRARAQRRGGPELPAGAARAQ